VAEGEITAVCCEIVHGVPPRSMPIPDDYRRRMQPYLSSATT